MKKSEFIAAKKLYFELLKIVHPVEAQLVSGLNNADANIFYQEYCLEGDNTQAKPDYLACSIKDFSKTLGKFGDKIKNAHNADYLARFHQTDDGFSVIILSIEKLKKELNESSKEILVT
jgi:hypothetical protein